MITDAIVSFLLGIFQPLIDLLPDGPTVAPEPMSGVVSILADVNDVVPIGPVLTVAVALLALLVPFLLFRAVVFLRHLLLP